MVVLALAVDVMAGIPVDLEEDRPSHESDDTAPHLRLVMAEFRFCNLAFMQLGVVIKGTGIVGQYF